MHAFGAEISATMDMLYLHCSLATGEHLSFSLLPLSYLRHIWIDHVFSAPLIMGKFDQNVQLTVNSAPVMN